MQLLQEQKDYTPQSLKQSFLSVLESLGAKQKILLIPPDLTRIHSMAGTLCEWAWEYYQNRTVKVLPALGSHQPMNKTECKTMFGSIPGNLFIHHHWRQDLETLGTIPQSFIRKVSENALDFAIQVQVHQIITAENWDLILSFSQVMPHEVAGMAGYTKNILIGTGGKDMIDKSHFIGAVYGIEKTLGNPENPVRAVFEYAQEHFLNKLPIVHILTVNSRNDDGTYSVKGLFCGQQEAYKNAAALAKKLNIIKIPRPPKIFTAYLNPQEYRSTWVGNKAIYRTRLAIPDNGKLIILAPGIKKFGEDPLINEIIRKNGYRGKDAILKLVQTYPGFAENLCAAAHLIHGCCEGRFEIIYCAGGLSKKEIEDVGYTWGDLKQMVLEYNPFTLHDGINRSASGEFYYLSNPGLGLWTA